jgi:adenylate cyclase
VRPLIRASITGVVAALVGMLVVLSPVGMALEERFGLGWLFWTRGTVSPPADVAVVSLDRRSAEELGLPAQPRYWPRRVFARLVERLIELKASVIVLDLVLDRPRGVAGDAALAAAIGAAKQVVLFEFIDRTLRPIGDGSAAAGVFDRKQLRPPLPAFAQGAAGSGPFLLPKVPTHVSRFWAFGANLDGHPSLSVVALQRYALDVYPRWRALLRAAGMGDADALPAKTTALQDAAALHQLIVQVRAAFLADPGLAERASMLLTTASLAPADRRLLHALITLYSGPDSRYLNFYGPPGTVPTTPLYQVLGDGARPGAGQQLAGRVVFVGLSDLDNPHEDDFPTVFSRADGVEIAGVEIAATALASLLEDRVLEQADPWTALAWLGLFGCAIGLLARQLPAVIAVPAALLLAVLFYTGAQLAFTRDNLWLPVAIPLLIQLPLGMFMGLLLQYRDARRARANISRGMHYYLPDKVARGFAGGPIDPSSLKEHVFAVCMVTDASRFTSLAESMTPEELSALLDQYFAILFGVVERHGGLVTDVVGDGTTSVWTAPAPERAARLRACLAALELSCAIDAFNDRYQRRTMPTRIGLNAGWAMVGNVGGSGRFAYSVVGDCVNTAARLQSLNKQLGTRIIAARALIEDLDEIVSRPLGRFQLCGKGEALRLVEVVGTAADAQRAGPVPEFTAALAAFEQGCWQDAGRRFATVLARDPSNGPARFYQKRCERYLAGAPPSVTGVIRLEHK